MCVCSDTQSCLTAIPWTVVHQIPLSMEFSRQKYWSRLPFPTPGDLPDPEIEPTSFASAELAGSLSTLCHLRSPHYIMKYNKFITLNFFFLKHLMYFCIPYFDWTCHKYINKYIRNLQVSDVTKNLFYHSFLFCVFLYKFSISSSNDYFIYVNVVINYV